MKCPYKNNPAIKKPNFLKKYQKKRRLLSRPASDLSRPASKLSRPASKLSRPPSKPFSRPGFTLLELIVVIIVIILLASTTISGIIRSQAVFRFNTAFQNVASIVREARSFAVTGKAQIDYKDYDKDTCKAGGAPPYDNDIVDCPLPFNQPDYVTPANYGIYIDTANNAMVLFADLHDSGTEGSYDAPPAATAIGEFVDGRDMKLAQYELPADYEFYTDPEGPGATTTVMYSPIFADTSFDPPLGVDFFTFGIREAPGFRNDCVVIHKVSGVPESAEKVGTVCPTPP